MTKEQHKAYYLHRLGRNPDYVNVKKNRYRVEATSADNIKNYHRRCLLNSIRSKCKKRNIPFNLTLEDIIIPDSCPVFGFTLERSEGYRSDRSASIDRIDPKLGYVKGNIVVVSMKANQMKSNGNWQELQKLADFYKKLDTFKESADNNRTIRPAATQQEATGGTRIR